MLDTLWEIAQSRKWIILAYTATALLIILLFSPTVISIHYLERGARLLEQETGSPDPAVRQAAIQHLQRAIRWNKRNDQAYRLLGKAYMDLGQPVQAAQMLEEFTLLRPRHQLGRQELEKAYQAVKAALHQMIYADLVVQAKQAVVSEPSYPAPHPFAPSDYVRTADPDLYSDRNPVPALFLHPVSAITYTLSLTQPAVLRFALGNILHAPAAGSDGITFEVYAEGQRLFLEHLIPDLSRQGWQEREVDLSAFVGQTISLQLVTTPGPAGDVTADWAVWGRPRVEANQAKAYWNILPSKH